MDVHKVCEKQCECCAVCWCPSLFLQATLESPSSIISPRRGIFGTDDGHVWARTTPIHQLFFFVRAPSPPPHCAAGGGGGASTSTIDGHQTISTIPKGSLIDISLLQSQRLTSACWCRRIRISIGVLGLFVYPCTRFLFSPKFYITVDAWSLSVSFHILLGEFLNI